MVKIIGIDPGLNITGWSVIEYNDNELSIIATGNIKAKSNDDLHYRLHYIYTAMENILNTYCPQHAAIEEIFVNKNPQSSLKLSMARSASLIALAQKQLSLHEYSPNKVKKTVAGSGHADKEQIMAMIKFLLPKSNIDQPDEADATAVAICHSQHFNALRYTG